ncbi:hypothetical protein B046DRAFT_02387 [Streptomyces sp. LamerLS-316]|uniref:hypothetical protein n=1 Tax=unclassified Streptomyces TaxID=2593676 RepID=UPI000823974E|nr:hypothetical protein [Streptomyces sp. LamerLS-316]SCK30984.1 hypothetical protein B046DRAFT_02387 [Streptomyces sp. LamerLS-316]
MRGLRGSSGESTTAGREGLRAGLVAGSTAVAGLAAFGLLCAGCSAGGTGTRDEGPANAQQAARATPTSTVPSGTAEPAPRVDAVRLVKSDPKVSRQLRDDLKPCTGDEYPVDTSYGTLTGGPGTDVVVNVMTCGDSVGVGTYVYQRQSDGSYGNVFAAEVPAVYGTIDRGDLVVTTQVYGSKDSVAYPSGEDVVTYRWAAGRFTETDRVHNDFNRAVGTGEGDLPAPQPTQN